MLFKRLFVFTVLAALTATFLLHSKPWKRNVSSTIESYTRLVPIPLQPDFYDSLKHTEEKWSGRLAPFALENYIFPRLFRQSSEEGANQVPLLFIHGHGGHARQVLPVYSGILGRSVGRLRVLTELRLEIDNAIRQADLEMLENLRRTFTTSASTVGPLRRYVKSVMLEATEADVAVAVAYLIHGRITVPGVLAAMAGDWFESADPTEQLQLNQLLITGGGKGPPSAEVQVFPHWRFGSLNMHQLPSALHRDFVELESHAVWGGLAGLRNKAAAGASPPAVVMAFSMGGVVLLRAIAGLEWRSDLESRVAAVVLLNVPLLIHPLLETGSNRLTGQQIRGGLRRLKAQGDGSALAPIIVHLRTAELDEAVWGLRGNAELAPGGLFRTVFAADLSQTLSSLFCHGDVLYHRASVAFLAEVFAVLGGYADGTFSRDLTELYLRRLLGTRGLPAFKDEMPRETLWPRQTPLTLPVEHLRALALPQVSAAPKTLDWWVYSSEGGGQQLSLASVAVIGGTTAIAFPPPDGPTNSFNWARYGGFKSLPLGRGTVSLFRNGENAPMVRLSDLPSLSIAAALVKRTQNVRVEELNRDKIDSLDDYNAKEAFPPCAVSSDAALRGLILSVVSPSATVSLRLVPTFTSGYPAAACLWQLALQEDWAVYETNSVNFDEAARSLFRATAEFELHFDLPSRFSGYATVQVVSSTAPSTGGPSSPRGENHRSGVLREEILSLRGFARWIWTILIEPLHLAPKESSLRSNDTVFTRLARLTSPLKWYEPLPRPELNWDLAYRPSSHDALGLRNIASAVEGPGRELFEQLAVWPRLVVARDEEFGITSSRYLYLPTNGRRVLEDGGAWRSKSAQGAFKPPNSQSYFATYRRGVFALLRSSPFAEYRERVIRVGVVSAPIRLHLLAMNETVAEGNLLLRGAADRWWKDSVRTAAAQVLSLVLIFSLFQRQVPLPVLSIAGVQTLCWTLCKGVYSAFPDDGAAQRRIRVGASLTSWLFPTILFVYCCYYALDLDLGQDRSTKTTDRAVAATANVLCVLLPEELSPYPLLLWILQLKRRCRGILPMICVAALWRLPDALGFCYGWESLPYHWGRPPLLLLSVCWLQSLRIGISGTQSAVLVALLVVAVVLVNTGHLTPGCLLAASDLSFLALTDDDPEDPPKGAATSAAEFPSLSADWDPSLAFLDAASEEENATPHTSESSRRDGVK